MFAIGSATMFLSVLAATIVSSPVDNNVSVAKASVSSTDHCLVRHRQIKQIHYISSVYHRTNVSKRSLKKIAKMRSCSFSRRASTKVLQFQRRQGRARMKRVVQESIPAHLYTIAQCESGGNPQAIDQSGTYRGKYQFDLRTWQSVGGRGDPAAAPEWMQDRLALALYRQRGGQPWPVCSK